MSIEFTDIIESTVRDLDYDTLVVALAGLSDDIRPAFLRCVSERARASIADDLKHRGDRVSDDQRKAAQQHLLQVLRNNAEQVPSEVPRRPERDLPSVNVESPAEITRTFRSLAEFAIENRFSSLEQLVETVEHPFLKKGLGMIVDGWDPLEWRAVLEKYKETYLHAIDTKLSMIIDGLDSLQSGDMPLAVVEKLKAYVAPE